MQVYEPALILQAHNSLGRTVNLHCIGASIEQDGAPHGWQFTADQAAIKCKARPAKFKTIAPHRLGQQQKGDPALRSDRHPFDMELGTGLAKFPSQPITGRKRHDEPQCQQRNGKRRHRGCKSVVGISGHGTIHTRDCPPCFRVKRTMSLSASLLVPRQIEPSLL